ncbi:MAG: exosortase system-associated protein, TIGR04073 family [Candidatus Omnitrophota bacterium]|jgi:putative exosortase-associated protein (TIGR04073 family)
MKPLACILGLTVLFVPVMPARAEPTPLKKLVRGTINLATAPLEVPKQTRLYWKKGAEKTDHILVWIFSGIVKGSVNTVGRIGSGTWDVVTFLIDIPENNQPLFQPDYVFDDTPDLF